MSSRIPAPERRHASHRALLGERNPDVAARADTRRSVHRPVEVPGQTCTNVNADVETTSAYAIDTVKLGTQWSFIGAVRLDHITSDYYENSPATILDFEPGPLVLNFPTVNTLPSFRAELSSSRQLTVASTYRGHLHPPERRPVSRSARRRPSSRLPPSISRRSDGASRSKLVPSGSSQPSACP